MEVRITTDKRATLLSRLITTLEIISKLLKEVGSSRRLMIYGYSKIVLLNRGSSLVVLCWKKMLFLLIPPLLTEIYAGYKLPKLLRMTVDTDACR